MMRGLKPGNRSWRWLLAWKRSLSTQGAFLFSLFAHGLLVLLLSLGSGSSEEEILKLTEVSYIEERYGAEVAKKVKIAEEKVEELVKKQAPPEAEGSMFRKPEPVAEKKEPVLAAAMTPLPRPKAREKKPAAPAAPVLRSRERKQANITTGQPRETANLALSSSRGPAARKTGSTLDLGSQVLVGRKANLPAGTPFAVESSDQSTTPSSDLTLFVPTGGHESGHPELTGGVLPQGKEAYRGELPQGLLDRSEQRGQTTLADSDFLPSPSSSEPQAAAMPAPTSGRGLVSRGGHGSNSRPGRLLAGSGPGGRSRPESTPDLDIPAPSRRVENKARQAAPAKSDKGVSVTLSGPISDRDILTSVAPEYPEEARRRGWQGVVRIYFTVDADGRVKSAVVEQASSHGILDRAARESVLGWSFSPLTRQKGAREQWGVLTIVYRLH